jgi:hypothetical protein
MIIITDYYLRSGSSVDGRCCTNDPILSSCTMYDKSVPILKKEKGSTFLTLQKQLFPLRGVRIQMAIV